MRIIIIIIHHHHHHHYQLIFITSENQVQWRNFIRFVTKVHAIYHAINIFCISIVYPSSGDIPQHTPKSLLQNCDDINDCLFTKWESILQKYVYLNTSEKIPKYF